jgi:membrane-associated protease RseP (regulator of RpoE activity)
VLVFAENPPLLIPLIFLFLWMKKFNVGLPTILPSIQMGCMGAITPLKSPPPNVKSLFDFGIAGPLAGLTTSLLFLVIGLIDMNSLSFTQFSELPVLPTFMLRSSALGGGLIEFFLGKGFLMQGLGGDNTFIPLHPFAITGFVGILANALALLPLGSK